MGVAHSSASTSGGGEGRTSSDTVVSDVIITQTAYTRDSEVHPNIACLMGHQGVLRQLCLQITQKSLGAMIAQNTR